MIGNKQAYQAAYDRALQGKGSWRLRDLLFGAFEDNYTRQSREQGSRDGAAARAQAADTTQKA